MPEYRLRSWSKETVFRCRDYLIDADTIGQAAALLREHQQQASEPTRVGSANRSSAGVLQDQERPSAKPEKLTDSVSGIWEIDKAGNRIRDVIDQKGAPTKIKRTIGRRTEVQLTAVT